MPRPPDRDQRAAPARGADGVHPLLQPRAAAPDAGPRDSGPALGHAGGEGRIETDSRWAPPRLRASRVNSDCILPPYSINQDLQQIIDQQTEPWGIKVSAVEVKDVELPQSTQRAIARQAAAEREKRAKVIAAEGEFQAAQTLANAAEVISTQPAALALRYMQTLLDMSSEKSSTIIFPVPIELIRPLLGGAKDESGAPGPETAGK